MLTIVVPTYNRHSNLDRIFSYYANSDFKVIIADGSDSPLDKNKIQSLAKNIIYCYDKNLDPVLRIIKLLDLIDTPYACLLADDELQLHSTLQESVRFLETHRDYSSCIGLCIGFKNTTDRRDINVKLIYPEFKNHTVNQDQFLERLKYHFNSYTACSIYGVQRTPGFKVALTTSHIQTSCVYAPEIAIELTNSVLGKLHILQKVSWLRNFDNPYVQSKKWNRKFRFHHWFNDPKYLSEKNIWMSDICSLLNSHTNLSISELNTSIESALTCYIEKLPEKKPNKLGLAINDFKSRIKSRIKAILKINKPIKRAFEGDSLTLIRSDLLKSDNILDLKDFDYAFSIIQKY